MDNNEIIALGIVGIAVGLLARHFFSKKEKGCCRTGCLSPKDEKEKTDTNKELKTR